MTDRLSPPRQFSPRVLLIAPLFLAGCAHLDDFNCDMHETSTRGKKPFTTYTAVEPKPGQTLPRILEPGSTPQAPVYTLSFKPGFTKPCTMITLQKEVVIHRGVESTLVLNEIREFYAENGALIASSTQDISEQVRKSGAYHASTPLPIPRTAPPGKYKIVSKLAYERRGDRRPSATIATAEGFFYIIPPQ